MIRMEFSCYCRQMSERKCCARWRRLVKTSGDRIAAAVTICFDALVKHEHWRAFFAIFVPHAAPMPEFGLWELLLSRPLNSGKSAPQRVLSPRRRGSKFRGRITGANLGPARRDPCGHSRGKDRLFSHRALFNGRINRNLKISSFQPPVRSGRSVRQTRRFYLPLPHAGGTESSIRPPASGP